MGNSPNLINIILELGVRNLNFYWSRFPNTISAILSMPNVLFYRFYIHFLHINTIDKKQQQTLINQATHIWRTRNQKKKSENSFRQREDHWKFDLFGLDHLKSVIKILYVFQWHNKSNFEMKNLIFRRELLLFSSVVFQFLGLIHGTLYSSKPKYSLHTYTHTN